MKRLLVLLLLAAFVPTAHTGAWADTPRGSDAVAEKEAGPDFEKLLDSVFKGIHEDPETNDLVTVAEKVLRRPGTKERTVLPESTRLNSIEAIRVRADGRQYTVLFCSAETAETEVPGGGAAILAVFPEGGAEALDVAEVKTDRFCGIDASRLLSLGPDDAFTITNSHHNSSQGYLNTTLFHIHGGRLQRVAEVSTLRLNGPCEKSFDETPAWRTEKDPAAPWPKVIATVTLTMGIGKDDGGDCPKSRQGFRKQVFSQTYRWNKAKDFYVSEGKGFDALDRFNAKHF
ncbi:MAG: hypothetical protein AB9866_09450 [Syntrophobacteraceae bacterium]